MMTNVSKINSGGFFSFLFVFVSGFVSSFFISPYVGNERINDLETKFNILDQSVSNLEHQSVKLGIQVDQTGEAVLILLGEHQMKSETLEKMIEADENGIVNK